MGAAGTDVALESADIALMGDDLNGVAEALTLSRWTDAVIRQNIALSLATKLLVVVLAAFGIVNLWIAVAADMGTWLAVTLNGMRLALPGRARRGGGTEGPEAAADSTAVPAERAVSPTLVALRMDKAVRAWPGERGRKLRSGRVAAGAATHERA